MLADQTDSWTWTLLAAAIAVASATLGLGVAAAGIATPALLAPALLLTSLASTSVAFTHLALRVRRLEMENLGLVEEISQEFDRVKDKIEIFSEALEPPRTLAAGETRDADVVASRRVVVK